MDYREFSQKVKAKYPGSYDDMDDRVLAEKMVQKFPEYSDVSFDEPQVEAPQGQPSIFDKTMDYSKKLFDYSPTGILMKGGEMAQAGFNKAGEMATEFLGKKQVNPYVSAGVGTAVSLTPDIFSTAAMTPRSIPKEAVKEAVPLARRALGFSKRFLGTPFSRGQATKAAETALEEKIIPYSGNPQTMFDRAKGLASKSGEAIKSMLKDVPADFDKAISDLESLRSNLTSGTKSGALSQVNSAIDDVVSSIREISAQSPSIERGVFESTNKSASILNKLKNRVAQKINYLSDLATQSDNKAIQNTLANSIRDMVKSFTSPTEFVQYLKNQKLYNAAALMEKGLNNEIAAQMGNRAISPYSMIAGGAQLAAGRPGAAAATLGVTEGLMRRAAGAGARVLQDVGMARPTTVPLVSLAAQRKFKNKPKKIKKNGHTYVLNEETGEYE